MPYIADLPLPLVIGRSVQAAMVAQDRTEAELAETLGVSVPALRRRLRGVSQWDASEIYRAARYLGLTSDDLMSGRLLAQFLPASLVATAA